MNEQEAIKRLKSMLESTEIFHAYEEYAACEVAISALEEIQQYRALGTVEELKEAREKQIAKKVIKKTENADGFRTGYVACPNCGAWVVRPISMNGCSKCLQRLDWSEI